MKQHIYFLRRVNKPTNFPSFITALRLCKQVKVSGGTNPNIFVSFRPISRKKLNYPPRYVSLGPFWVLARTRSRVAKIRQSISPQGILVLFRPPRGQLCFRVICDHPCVTVRDLDGQGFGIHLFRVSRNDPRALRLGVLNFLMMGCSVDGRNGCRSRTFIMVGRANPEVSWVFLVFYCFAKHYFESVASQCSSIGKNLWLFLNARFYERLTVISWCEVVF